MSKRIAVTSASTDGLDAQLDPRFGRAMTFLIVDVDGDNRKIVAQIKNSSVQAAHGAGTGAAAIMSDNEVNAVISGSFGPKAYQALDQLGIEMWTTNDQITASEALDKLAAKELTKMAVKVY